MALKLRYICFFLLQVIVSADYSPVEANDESWEEVVNSAPLILAGFFAPWCAHCKKLQPQWNDVAEHFAYEEHRGHETELVKVVSVDVVENQGLYWRYDIASFPTIRLFREGVALSTCDEREASSIIEWTEERRKLLTTIPVISSSSPVSDQLFDLMKSHELSNPSLNSALVGIFAPEHHRYSEAFKSLAILLHNTNNKDELASTPLGMVNDADSTQQIAQLLDLSVEALHSGPAIVLLRNFSGSVSSSVTSHVDNMEVLYGDSLFQLGDKDENDRLIINDKLIGEIKKWSETEKWPTVMQWSSANQPFIFTRRPGFSTHVLLLLPSSSSSDSLDFLSKFQEVAKQHVPHALFLYSEDDQDGEIFSLMASLGIEANSLPSSIVIRSSSSQGSVSYYRRTNQDQPFVSSSELQLFIEDYFAGRLEADVTSQKEESVRSEPVEEVDEKDVLVIRDESDFDVLLEKTDKSKDTCVLVIVEFYAPWCGHCKKLKPEFAKAATALRDQAVTLAKADATDKKLEDLSKKLQVQGYPSLFVCFRGSVLKYGGANSFQSLVDTTLNLIARSNEVEEAIKHYLILTKEFHSNARTKHSQLNKVQLSDSLLVRTKSSLDELLLSASKSSMDAKTVVLALLLVPSTATSSEDQATMAHAFESFHALVGRTSLDDSALGSTDISVWYRVVEASDETISSLTNIGFPVGISSVISANQVPVLVIQKVPSYQGLSWEPATVAPTELLLEPSPNGVFSAEWSSQRALNFIKFATRPAVVGFGDNSAFHTLMETPEVLQLLLFDDYIGDAKGGDDESLALAKAVDNMAVALGPLVNMYAKRFVVVLVDQQAEEALGYFKLSVEDLPAGRLVDITAQRSYLISLPEDAELRGLARAEQEYMNALVVAMGVAFDSERNNLTPVRRIQAVEEAELGRPNQLIVGEQWDSYVLQRNQLDVLVLYFDPNCPHCKAMRPILEKIAKKASLQGALYPQGNLAVVEMDVSANDPLEGESWSTPEAVPAVHLYPAVIQRKADNFVAYEGGPDVEALKSFIAKHAVHHGDPSPPHQEL